MNYAGLSQPKSAYFLEDLGISSIQTTKKASIEDVLYTFSFPLKHNDAPRCPDRVMERRKDAGNLN